MNPFELLDKISPYFKALERFTVILYDKTIPLESVKETRNKLFWETISRLENLPPTWAIFTWLSVLAYCRNRQFCPTIWQYQVCKQLQMSPCFLLQDGLLQHCKRAIYEARIWITSDQSNPFIPFPVGYGWTKIENTWTPVRITIPKVCRSCRELIKCSCKGNCSNCKCGKANLACSRLCNSHCNERQWGIS